MYVRDSRAAHLTPDKVAIKGSIGLTRTLGISHCQDEWDQYLLRAKRSRTEDGGEGGGERVGRVGERKREGGGEERGKEGRREGERKREGGRKS